MPIRPFSPFAGFQSITFQVWLLHEENFGRYIQIEIVKSLCNYFNIPSVCFDLTKFDSIEQLRELANQPSEVAIPYVENHIREGIVVVAGDDPAKMAKCFSFDYLARKNKKERH